MIDKDKVLGLIPARGGSKGLPRKNILPVAGKPLIGWTIEAAKNSRYLDRLILSSDDREILETAEALGCESPFVRPEALATDSALAIDVIRHAVEAVNDHFDYIVLLQPTSPLRTT